MLEHGLLLLLLREMVHLRDNLLRDETTCTSVISTVYDPVSRCPRWRSTLRQGDVGAVWPGRLPPAGRPSSCAVRGRAGRPVSDPLGPRGGAYASTEDPPAAADGRPADRSRSRSRSRSHLLAGGHQLSLGPGPGLPAPVPETRLRAAAKQVGHNARYHVLLCTFVQLHSVCPQSSQICLPSFLPAHFFQWVRTEDSYSVTNFVVFSHIKADAVGNDVNVKLVVTARGCRESVGQSASDGDGSVTGHWPGL